MNSQSTSLSVAEFCNLLLVLPFLTYLEVWELIDSLVGFDRHAPST